MADAVDDLLTAATSALRDEARPDDAPIEATRRRVMASAGEGRRVRRGRVGFAVLAFALSIATLSWAASTGRLDGVLERVGVKAPRMTRMPVTEPATVADTDTDTDTVTDTVTDTDTVTAPVTATAPVPHVRVAKRTPAPAPKLDDGADLAAYRRAHALHFRGGAPAETLAAWDAYLAAFPTGRFAADARYNRAIVLVRLDRIEDARTALAPFAAGEIEHGYRQREAIELRDALAGEP